MNRVELINNINKLSWAVLLLFHFLENKDRASTLTITLKAQSHISTESMLDECSRQSNISAKFLVSRRGLCTKKWFSLLQEFIPLTPNFFAYTGFHSPCDYSLFWCPLSFSNCCCTRTKHLLRLFKWYRCKIMSATSRVDGPKNPKWMKAKNKQNKKFKKHPTEPGQ